jgi:hypothetical protein
VNLSVKIRDVLIGIKRNRVNLIVVFAWSLLIAILLIRAYVEFIYGNIGYTALLNMGYSPPGFETWEGFELTSLELLLIAVVSLLCGAFMLDIRRVFYGSFGTFLISFSLTTAYIAYFIWHTLGWERALSLTAGGWSWAVYWGFLNVFRATFPVAFLSLIMCALGGAFLRSVVQ